MSKHGRGLAVDRTAADTEESPPVSVAPLFDPVDPVFARTTSGQDWPVGRVFCLGRNYHDHIAEMNAVVDLEALPFFTKWSGAVTNDAHIPYPPETQDWHHEVEMVAAIHRAGAAVSEAEALDLIWGYAVGVDMTRRDLQALSKSTGHPWDWAKNGDRSAPLAPIRPVSEVGHPSAGPVWLDVNRARRQEGDLKQMIWSSARTVAYLSRFFPLKPGDLVFLGTPAGVGPLSPGDQVRAGVVDLPELSFTVV